jgi:Tol biopolymer transport system component
MVGVGLLALAATAVAIVVYLGRKPPEPVFRFSIASPDHADYPGPPAISPDGRFLAFPAVAPGGSRMLWLRPLDDLKATPIPGTDGAAAPFWSPDSRSIAFFAYRFLKKVRVSGGRVERICPAETLPGGGTWSRRGTILFAPGLDGGLYRVPAAGGRPEPVVAPDAAESGSAYLLPQFLPDGRHFVFFVHTRYEESSGVYLASLDHPRGRLLFASETNAVWSPEAGESSDRNGYLLYILGDSLVARRFELSRFTTSGDPIPVAENVGAVRSLSLSPVSVSANAILAYQPLDSPLRRAAWMDRAGNEIASATDAGQWGALRISPDGRKALVAHSGAQGESLGLWMLNAAGGATPLTSDSYHEGSPVWSPDGSRIAFFSDRDGHYDIYIGGANPGARAELAFASPFPKYPTDWSRDGRYLLFGSISRSTKSDVWALSVADRRATPLIATVYNEGYPALSPDGNWLAYQSDESGQTEVYVQPFDNASPGTKRKWQISQGGGGLPRWRADGEEIFYITARGSIMAAAVHPNRSIFSSDAPRMLFRTQCIPRTWDLYDVSPDGQRFLINLPVESSRSSHTAIVTNWTRSLKR